MLLCVSLVVLTAVSNCFHPGEQSQAVRPRAVHQRPAGWDSAAESCSHAVSRNGENKPDLKRVSDCISVE